MNKIHSSLYRGLAVPFAVFVLLASLALAGYISYWVQQDALRQLERMAGTNVKFMEELQLPRSAGMADKLSTVLGVWVGFHDTTANSPQFENAPWPKELKAPLKKAISQGSANFHFNGHEVAIASFGDQRTQLVLVRESRSLLATGLGDAVLVPTMILTIACVLLAFYLARRIVKPLTNLTNWLPHLQHDDRAAPAIPAAVSSRGDEIGALARALEATHRRLRDEQDRRRQSERMATLGRIATSLAHEIRNPASSISLHADLLARKAVRDNTESIRLIRAEVDRINDLVNQWLFVVRPAPPQSSTHDLVELVLRISGSLRAAMDHAAATLRISEPTEALPVYCDHARIEQVVRNLLVNATQAMPEGGEIRIRFDTADGYAALIIEDSGPGFSEEALARFGEPFFSEREGGMGIGLTLAREVIEAHGGTITARNAPDGGAVVRVQLPLAQPVNPQSK